MDFHVDVHGSIPANITPGLKYVLCLIPAARMAGFSIKYKLFSSRVRFLDRYGLVLLFSFIRLVELIR